MSEAKTKEELAARVLELAEVSDINPRNEDPLMAAIRSYRAACVSPGLVSEFRAALNVHLDANAAMHKLQERLPYDVSQAVWREEEEKRGRGP